MNGKMIGDDRGKDILAAELSREELHYSLHRKYEGVWFHESDCVAELMKLYQQMTQ